MWTCDLKQIYSGKIPVLKEKEILVSIKRKRETGGSLEMNCEGQENRRVLEPAPDKHGGFAWNLSTGEAEAEGPKTKDSSWEQAA